MAINGETATSLRALPKIHHGFFARTGGVSTGAFSSLNCGNKVLDQDDAVEENRRRALSHIGCDNYLFALPKIAHGSSVVVVDKADDWPQLSHIDADAVITSQPHIALAVTYADCLPILVATENSSFIAAIHAGWRGVHSGVIAACIARMRSFSPTTPLIAAVGPAISQRGFQVSDDVAAYFHQAWPQFTERKLMNAYVDLTAIAVAQLNDLDVRAEKIGGYTDREAEKYFSHRRDHGVTGRHVAVIAKNQH